VTFIKAIKLLVVCFLLNAISTGVAKVKDAPNFTGYYRQVTPLCDRKLDNNPRELSRYSGIHDCYEGKKRMGTAAKFWVIQNESRICGYWELAANKVWSGSLVGIVRNGNASVFYEDGHTFGGDAPRYIFKINISGDLKVTDLDFYGFPSNVTHLERMKTRTIDSELIKNCKPDFLPPLKINEGGEMILNDRLDPETIQKAFGDVSEKVIYKAPSSKTITIDKQPKAFNYSDVRRDNNFVPRDVTVRNLSNRPWVVRSDCYPESENYFRFEFKNHLDEIKPRYAGYATKAMDDEVQLKPGQTIRVLSCRSFGVYFEPHDEAEIIKK
jgi:hypothetical protein